jgi:hypothetical protein
MVHQHDRVADSVHSTGFYRETTHSPLVTFDVDTAPSNTANPSEPGRERWLDRWCAPRWRALLTWMVLTAVAGENHAPKTFRRPVRSPRCNSTSIGRRVQRFGGHFQERAKRG